MGLRERTGGPDRSSGDRSFWIGATSPGIVEADGLPLDHRLTALPHPALTQQRFCRAS